MAGEYFQYNTTILNRAEELKKTTGLSWKEVAARLRIPNHLSLQQTMSLRRHGKHGERVRQRDAWREELPEVERKIMKGMSVAALAKEYQITLPAMHNRLVRAGLDLEVRRELMETSAE